MVSCNQVGIAAHACPTKRLLLLASCPLCFSLALGHFWTNPLVSPVICRHGTSLFLEAFPAHSRIHFSCLELRPQQTLLIQLFLVFVFFHVSSLKIKFIFNAYVEIGAGEMVHEGGLLSYTGPKFTSQHPHQAAQWYLSLPLQVSRHSSGLQGTCIHMYTNPHM